MGFTVYDFKSNYKGVRKRVFLSSGKFPRTYFESTIRINGETYRANHDNERAAAIWYDLKRIEAGMKPINVLKKK